MNTFKLAIPDMNCGHCKMAVEKAVASVDADAGVVIDLERRTAIIDTDAPLAAVQAALQGKGYRSDLAA